VPVTEPTPDDPVDDRRTDEDRDISDVGLPHPGDAGKGDDHGRPDVDEAALDEVFPPADGQG
jgi:hypothetical protein